MKQIKQTKQPKPFEKLSRKEQKLRIVKDAIIQIENKRITPSNAGNYMRIFDLDSKSEMSIQKILKEDVNKCECCAKGALFASCVINVNNVTRSDFYSDEEFQKEKLSKWFSDKELDTIETAFEGQVIVDSSGTLEVLVNGDHWEPTKLANKAIKFGEQYRTSETRMLAILNNILENGRFKL